MNFADRAELCPPHALTPDEAIALQDRWRSRVITDDQFAAANLKHIAGIDVGYTKDGTMMQAAIVVLDRPSLTVLDSAIATGSPSFPYTPGLLSFREVPIIVAALAKLTMTPDLLVCDGQGFAHPRRFGLACHLGVLTDIPVIGIAKSHYIGDHAPLEMNRGAWQPLVDQGETIGAIVRTQTQVKPVYVSIGHRISLDTAIALALELSPRYRLPETTRQADHRSRQFSTHPVIASRSSKPSER